MKITVRVKPGSKRERVEKVDGRNYLVWVRQRPQDGEANQAVTEALAEYFDISKSRVVLWRGQASREKIFTINE
jgi:uncharacterized protein